MLILKPLYKGYIKVAPNIIVTLLTLLLFSCGATTQMSDNNSGSNNFATLTWDSPTINADGTSLNDLAGYKIYYWINGKSPTVIDVGCTPCSSSCPGTAQPQTCSYTIRNLTSGTYYFAVTAYDADGNESDYSNTGYKMIP